MTSTFHPARSLAGLLALMGVCAEAAAADAGVWATAAALKQQLATPLSVAWDNAPLSRALLGLSQTQQVAILRDRRIDPTQPLELAIDNKPLSEALASIAGQLQIGYCQFGPVAYFGPPETAARLRTLAALRREEVRHLSPDASRKFFSMRNWQWNRLAEPRALAAALADEAGVELVDVERIPHDLWPEADLPPMSWIDRLTLLAAQFDLTFRIDDAGHRVALVAMPDKVAISRTYLGGRDAMALARRWARELPEAKIAAADNKIRVEARLEDHERLEAHLRGKPTRRTTVTAGEQMHQLSVENAALDKVVEQLAKRLSLDVQWERGAIQEAGIAADQLISVQVADASLDELLDAVFAGTGLSCQRKGRLLVIEPSK